MKISYLIGLPVGLFAILTAMLLPTMVTGESLAGFLLNDTYGAALIGLVISFIIALGIAGHYASLNIQNQKSVLETSFRYTITVNAIIWSVFIILTIIGNDKKDFWFLLIPPFIAFLLCTLVTTFTVGLLICYLIKSKYIK